jgi:ribosome-binding factor A
MLSVIGLRHISGRWFQRLDFYTCLEKEEGWVMVSRTRATRIADRIRQELAEILLLKSMDPRLAGISVTDVTVDRELAFAEVYVCALEGTQQSESYLMALEHAQGFLRSELARRVELRAMPKLRFHWDPTFERAEVIERLISTLHNDNQEEDIDGTGEQPGK